ncbi:UDP-N-acetylmuramoyl-tripeptide--D-alanyl-D-alanine ligase [Actinoplanes sp. NBRC 103695]|uniref:UDP-N-acetylmuramoyl-tripeptide--D-alanyl-D- alanine ligase n=1 Tax=Actinoplanes sp. NBRC 103695 TaxID=3032202 RepID=UPI0024A27FA9|nr:UDP-N-acetylmuramoyl-tripeptide--D-alanyl-D-alanine ligase [Actinoplanes sp. NBRC 103695]GLZ02360.1 UDP-N-acetylmuramoyl-tripeptide--D-alanyl-D-alanine ligase [Actinoplanes sp. NBRC 103695]
MLTMTLAELASAVGGTLRDADPNAVVTAPVRYDSRLIEPGGLFAAFPGVNVDGHEFAARAVADGAAVVLGSRPVGVPAVVVEDVRAALGRLAAALVIRATGLTVVGVTGSVGKTTTKDLLGPVLSRLGPTVAPPGNLNNEIGLPSTVSLITAETRFLVSEMGARNVGDVTYLAGLVQPRVGIVTAIGTPHLSGFGTLEITTKAKSELIEALPADGRAVLNADDHRVAGMAAKSAAPVTFYGASADVRAEDITVDALGRASFLLCTPAGSSAVAMRLIGEHYVSNALAAAAAALAFTDDVSLIADALSSAARASEGRMQVSEIEPGITVINDAYSSSPTSTAAALKTAAALAQGRRLLAVLGQMNELGADSPRHHTELGGTAADAGVRYLIGVGNADAGRIAAAASAGGVEVEHVPDAAAALALIHRRWAAGDVVLIKGSNSLGLQAVAKQLVAEGASDPAHAATQGNG